MKKIIAVLMLVLVLFSLTSAVSADAMQKQATLYYNDIKITLDGKEITPVDANGNPVDPFTISGTTYLPVRAVSNALGLKVDWDAATKTVILESVTDHSSVYITRTGSKYHYDNTCNGGTYWPVPIETAEGMGLTPCEKCVIPHIEG